MIDAHTLRERQDASGITFQFFAISGVATFTLGYIFRRQL
jgi:hypothetical protein